MAKEMMIVFIYDTGTNCQKDELAESIVYFHPGWVSPTQKLALAGQLMGVYQFLASTFTSPYLISLQGGKFILKKLGQYVLAVGTDRNIQDWISQRRADILESLINFFHCDIETILISSNNDRQKFIEKLYQIFETYLPILQYNTSLFSSIPSVKLPKSSGNIFLGAIRILKYFQETNGIVGGAIFHNNKVIASQLSAEITKQLVLMDPFRIKAPAERVTTNFHPPIGVQLFYVYVEDNKMREMIRNANMERGYSSYLRSNVHRAVNNKKGSNKIPTREQAISSIKRDTSRIFTVPEEGEFQSTIPSDLHNLPEKQEDKKRKEVDLVGISTTPSVCSTPLRELNRVLHSTSVSICNIADDTDIQNERTNLKENSDDIPEAVKEAVWHKRFNLSKQILDQQFVRHKPNIKRNLSVNDVGMSNEGWRKYNLRKVSSKTITDPCFPVFRHDGLEISQSLYNQYISSHYKIIEDSLKILSGDSDSMKAFEKIEDRISTRTRNQAKSSQVKYDSSTVLDVRFDDNRGKSKINKSKRRSLTLPLKPLNILENDEGKKSESEDDGEPELQSRKKLHGLQLTPLMSKLSILALDEKIGCVGSRGTTPSDSLDFPGQNSSSNVIKRKLETVDNDVVRGSDEIEEDGTIKGERNKSLQKTELFLCGHQNMVLVLLMESGMCSDPELVHFLWQTCVSNLEELEERLQKCSDPLPTTDNKELYSVLTVDSEWDTTHRFGLWGVTESDVISILHNRFIHSTNLTDIIVRLEDAVVYGNQTGKVEVYYHQSMACSTIGGLPTPADLMGTIPLKAKRRVERDHQILLF